MGQLAHPLEIRAHHLLCLLGFRGSGYSQEFVEKMGKVANELHLSSTFPIAVLAQCDVICVSCPHNKDNKCQKKVDSESKAEARDLEVLRRLGFAVGAQMPVEKVWVRIKARLTPDDIVEICQGCEWLELGYCADSLDRLGPVNLT